MLTPSISSPLPATTANPAEENGIARIPRMAMTTPAIIPQNTSRNPQKSKSARQRKMQKITTAAAKSNGPPIGAARSARHAIQIICEFFRFFGNSDVVLYALGEGAEV